MIIKVQISLEGSRTVLAYDEKRTFEYQGPLTPDIAMLMGQRPKAFFHARVNTRKELAIDREAGWQNW